jgi:tRNA(fMet)-specific endonuclease VapC
MIQLLLDTSVLVGAERAGDALERIIGDDDDIAIAAVTIAELRVGALLADGRRRAARAKYIDQVSSAVSILGYDTEVAETHAELLVAVLRQGRPRGAHDLIIAATAKKSGRTVVTADVNAFADLPGVSVRS